MLVIDRPHNTAAARCVMRQIRVDSLSVIILQRTVSVQSRRMIGTCLPQVELDALEHEPRDCHSDQDP